MKNKLQEKFDYKRIIHFMLVLLIFFTIIKPANAQSTSAQVKKDIKVSNITVLQLVDKLGADFKYSFFIVDELIGKSIISVDLKNATINEILESAFKGKDIVFVVKNKNITISTKKIKNAEPQITTKTKIVSGVVLDEKGLPVIGASVIIPGTTIGVATDINGRFTLEAPSNAKLRISYIGYEAKEELLNASSDLKIKLEPTPQALTEIVITAQAIGQKNAILQQINSNTIKNVVAADRLQENPDANATEAIGRLPGISVVRSGGEGVGLVVRGMEPRYTQVTLNGMQMPSTGGSDRGSNLSGISQYALQGAEVFKALTADMEANSVGGTVNLKLREAPKDFHLNIMTQKGYNHLNNDFSNYKFLFEFSNRFFENKLGVLFTANSERVNRSTQSMSANYGIPTKGLNDPILINSINLNDIKRDIERKSALLSLDYKLSPGTTIMLYGMYSNSNTKTQSQSKNYIVENSGGVSYNFSDNPLNKTDMFQSTLTGESKFKFLNIKADYGVGYSFGYVNSESRSWNFTFSNASNSSITTVDQRKKTPQELIPLFTDNPNNLIDCWLDGISKANSNINDKNLNTFLNFTIPIKLDDKISGYIKLGGKYQTKDRVRIDRVGSQATNYNAMSAFSNLVSNSLDWIERNPEQQISAVGLNTGKNVDFLQGQYNFGQSFDLARLNQLSDAWENISNEYFIKGTSVYLPVFGDVGNLDYRQSYPGSVINNQNIKESYTAAYLLSEINYGKYIMFLPGVRFEETHAQMLGMYATPPQKAPSLLAPIVGVDTMANRSDKYILPMIHLRIKPTDYYYFHLSFTQTLSRPDFNAINPNYYVNTGWIPLSYTAGNPNLKPELWTNYDAQFTIHKNKIGLLSVTAFYKTVKGKIWQRTYDRISGDPTIEPFTNTSKVTVSIWENHPNDVYLKGLEFEWQTNFNYLPKPFSYLTFSLNYTYTNSKTSYPFTRFAKKYPPGGGAPATIRVDSVILGPMTFQPKNIANISLGYNKSGLNVWLSFQYNGQIYTNINYHGVPRLDALKDNFVRWDLQIAQKFAIRKIGNFEVVANIANLSNFTENQHNAGDSRPNYQENYGWTTDLGLRYRF